MQNINCRRHTETNRAQSPSASVMSSALYLVLLFSALWTLSFCWTPQFHVVEENKTWTDAQNYCRETFTDLATIENQEHMNAVKAVLTAAAGNAWIGLRRKINADSWIWSDGSNSSYRDWDTREPNNGVGDYCVQLLQDHEYRWNDECCQWANPFICYKAIPLILIKEEKTWREALSYCRENHVDLVSVHTEEIQHWVETAVYYASTANVWMGLRHTCTLSFWFWVKGEFICYQNWAPGNGTGVEDCSGGERTGAVQSGSKQWVSLPEDQRLNFICTTSEGK
ncbi:macrophage mannose receptor 1-like [Pygocentrus nattereri]|uniref:C-type lectin domain-containing protein n=1 Tax=Pygocentrus nattereri TaxID=42514 RepID=A0AAR2KTP4_PYGNA|nr:macrophage mannose receptor 1-like [Pygocentrus nattereri]